MSEVRDGRFCDERKGSNGSATVSRFAAVNGCSAIAMKLSRRLIRLISLLLVEGHVPEHKRTP
jgi:hypothetical protein